MGHMLGVVFAVVLIVFLIVVVIVNYNVQDAKYQLARCMRLVSNEALSVPKARNRPVYENSKSGRVYFLQNSACEIIYTVNDALFLETAIIVMKSRFRDVRLSMRWIDSAAVEIFKGSFPLKPIPEREQAYAAETLRKIREALRI